MQRILGFLLFTLTLPLYPLLFIVIKLTSSGPFIFKQKRMGKNKKIFTMYKFRTMVENAEQLKTKYLKLNEADGPVFKIHNDPRYTKIGKILTKTAIDELPQLVNIIKGEMAFVGPRPLPVAEARQVPAKYGLRFEVLPGLTSTWVIKGGHTLTFDQWMKLDCEYVKTRNTKDDLIITLKTIILLTNH
ncbi:MAG: sugar transferase [Candidatus Levybacteria bacterium]|nr:sugar transferase [Candidatus Levybacteria bacterium]